MSPPFSRAARRACLAALALAAAGCAHIPYFKKWAKKPYYPYLANDLYSFEYPRKWGEPAKVEYGNELREPEGRMTISIEFLPKNSKDFVAPEKYRKEMSQWGSVEDEHRVYRIQVSSRPAYQVRFTAYDYDARYLLGEQVRVMMTEQTVVPDLRGMFRVSYRSPREEFWSQRNRKQLEHFWGSLVLSVGKEAPAILREEER